MVIQEESTDLATSSGPMRTYVYRPVAPGRYPGIVLFSEIFQRTGPIKRAAAFVAGHGFVVAVPEIFHELEAPGTELPYDPSGTERGNQDKVGKTVAAYDADARAVIAFLLAHPSSTGKLGAMGICVGGHLAYRAAMNPEVRAAACFYATDIHKHGLGQGMNDDTLERTRDLKAEMLMIWGRQDPHIPTEGRALIQARMNAEGVRFTWHELNGAHAFIRDEGPRYDPELTRSCQGLVLDLFRRKLGEGDLPQAAPAAGSQETRH